MQLRVLFSLVLVMMVILMAGSSEAGRNKKEKGKKANSTCKEWQWGTCEPASGDCGTGLREGTCKEKEKTENKIVKCKVPCNWKKQFGGDCKYKFGNWGECDTETGLKTRNGTLKKALFNAECEQSVKVTKSCDKSKTKSKGKKGKKGM